jgi:hypothetical protein
MSKRSRRRTVNYRAQNAARKKKTRRTTRNIFSGLFNNNLPTNNRKTYKPYKKRNKKQNHLISRKAFLRNVSQWRARRKSWKASRAFSSVTLYRTLTNPKKSLVCAARALRREVIFASGKGGKRGQKKPIWRNKDIRCKK